MLEIVRGRPWSVSHTVYDTEDSLSDLSGITTLKSQIREKYATKDKDGHLVHALVADATVTKVDLASTITLSLTQEQTTALFAGDYLIDLIADAESYLDPEPIRVVNRPTVL